MALAFGAALRDWRTSRRMSQLDLGLSANVSARHISFLETGRSQPSRGMVLRLCDELDVPRAARNQLLTAAGMAPAYEGRDLDADDMVPVREAVDWMLERHAPFPAMAMDRHWRLVAMNRPSAMLLSGMGIGPGDSMVEALIDNDAVRNALENLEEVIRHTIIRLRTESAHLGGDATLDRFAAALTESSNGVTHAEPGILPPFIPARYRAGDTVLSLFSTFAQFGTAEDVALSELKIEMMFPADSATREFLAGMAEGPVSA